MNIKNTLLATVAVASGVAAPAFAGNANSPFAETGTKTIYVDNSGTPYVVGNGSVAKLDGFDAQSIDDATKGKYAYSANVIEKWMGNIGASAIPFVVLKGDESTKVLNQMNAALAKANETPVIYTFDHTGNAVETDPGKYLLTGVEAFAKAGPDQVQKLRAELQQAAKTALAVLNPGHSEALPNIPLGEPEQIVSATPASTDQTVANDAVASIAFETTVVAPQAVNTPSVSAPVLNSDTGYLAVEGSNAYIMIGKQIAQINLDSVSLKHALKEAETNTNPNYTMNFFEVVFGLDASAKAANVKFLSEAEAGKVALKVQALIDQTKAGGKVSAYSFDASTIAVTEIDQTTHEALLKGIKNVHSVNASEHSTAATTVKTDEQNGSYQWLAKRYSRVSTVKLLDSDAEAHGANGEKYFVPGGEYATRNPWEHNQGGARTPINTSEPQAAQTKNGGDNISPMAGTTTTTVVPPVAPTPEAAPPAAPEVKPPTPVVTTPNVPTDIITVVPADNFTTVEPQTVQNNINNAGHKWWELPVILGLIGAVAAAGIVFFDRKIKQLQKQPMPNLESIGTIEQEAQKKAKKKRLGWKYYPAALLGTIATVAASILNEIRSTAKDLKKAAVSKIHGKKQVSAHPVHSSEALRLNDQLGTTNADPIAVSRHDLSVALSDLRKKVGQSGTLPPEAENLHKRLTKPGADPLPVSRNDLSAILGGLVQETEESIAWPSQQAAPAFNSGQQPRTAPSAGLAAAAAAAAVSIASTIPVSAALNTPATAASQNTSNVDPALTPPPLLMTPPPLPVSATQNPYYQTSKNWSGIESGGSVFAGSMLDHLTAQQIKLVYVNQR